MTPRDWGLPASQPYRAVGAQLVTTATGELKVIETEINWKSVVAGAVVGAIAGAIVRKVWI